jgi:hypothetical protein
MFYRSAPYPTLTTFDSPDFQSVCTRRQRSNTPLQALTMANDVAMYELAQGLAAQALEQQPSGDPTATENRIELVFERALGRHPSVSELRLMQSFLSQHSSAQPNAEADAWTAVARAVMNTDEFITRE